MEMLTWLEHVADSKDGFMILLIAILFFAMVVDFLLGTGISIFSKDKNFSSGKLKLGLLIKILEIVLVVLVLVPLGIVLGSSGMIAVTAMVVGFIVAELYSIVGQLRNCDKDNNWLETLETFIGFVKNSNTDKK